MLHLAIADMHSTGKPPGIAVTGRIAQTIRFSMGSFHVASKRHQPRMASAEGSPTLKGINPVAQPQGRWKTRGRFSVTVGGEDAAAVRFQTASIIQR